jgi:hypothetical protein
MTRRSSVRAWLLGGFLLIPLGLSAADAPVPPGERAAPGSGPALTDQQIEERKKRLDDMLKKRIDEVERRFAERQSFESQAKDERIAFEKSAVEERKTFLESLKRLDAASRRGAWHGFNEKQKGEHRAFEERERARREAFRDKSRDEWREFGEELRGGDAREAGSAAPGVPPAR